MLLAIGLVLATAACGSSSTSAGDYGQNHAVSIHGTQATVVLKNIAFSPKAIKVRTGTTVTWVNEDPVIHDVISITYAFATPAPLHQGESYSFTFVKPGIYRYQCTFHHPSMLGTVIVEG